MGRTRRSRAPYGMPAPLIPPLRRCEERVRPPRDPPCGIARRYCRHRVLFANITESSPSHLPSPRPRSGHQRLYGMHRLCLCHEELLLTSLLLPPPRSVTDHTDVGQRLVNCVSYAVGVLAGWDNRAVTRFRGGRVVRFDAPDPLRAGRCLRIPRPGESSGNIPSPWSAPMNLSSPVHHSRLMVIALGNVFDVRAYTAASRGRGEALPPVRFLCCILLSSLQTSVRTERDPRASHQRKRN